MMSQKDVSLGEFLRQERELRGITIEQVASATKVGIRTLHALEADHYSELPAKPFVRGFVNSYCRFIGLDSKELLARFDDYISEKSNERPTREAGHSGYAFEKRDGEQQSRTLLMVAIFSFIMVGGVAILFLKPTFHRQRASHLDKLRAAHLGEDLATGEVKPGILNSENSQFASVSNAVPGLTLASSVTTSQPILPAPVTKTPELPPAPVGAIAVSVSAVIKGQKIPESKPVENPEPASEDLSGATEQHIAANPADPLDSGLTLKKNEIRHKIIFKMLADIWVRYRVDGRPIRKFIVRKGNSLVLRAKDEITLQVSNPKSVMFNYNSQGSNLIEIERNHAAQQGNSLYLFPRRKTADAGTHFGGEVILPQTPDPSLGAPVTDSKTSD